MYGSETSDNALDNSWLPGAGTVVLNTLVTLYLIVSMPPIVFACVSLLLPGRAAGLGCWARGVHGSAGGCTHAAGAGRSPSTHAQAAQLHVQLQLAAASPSHRGSPLPPARRCTPCAPGWTAPRGAAPPACPSCCAAWSARCWCWACAWRWPWRRPASQARCCPSREPPLCLQVGGRGRWLRHVVLQAPQLMPDACLERRGALT